MQSNCHHVPAARGGPVANRLRRHGTGRLKTLRGDPRSTVGSRPHAVQDITGMPNAGHGYGATGKAVSGSGCKSPRAACADVDRPTWCENGGLRGPGHPAVPERQECDASALAATATPSPDAPPEFAAWLAALRVPQ